LKKLPNDLKRQDEWDSEKPTSIYSIIKIGSLKCPDGIEITFKYNMSGFAMIDDKVAYMRNFKSN